MQDDDDCKHSGLHPAPGEFSKAQIETDPILHFFHYKHLPPNLAATSVKFFYLAQFIVVNLPRNAERTVALRKLLEAKDAAVRANLPAPGASVEKCQHNRIYAAEGSDVGKCTACDERVSIAGYAQSATAAPGFLMKLYAQEIGEPVEIGGADIDRDGPVDFGS